MTDKEIAGTNAKSFVARIRRKETWKELTQDIKAPLLIKKVQRLSRKRVGCKRLTLETVDPYKQGEDIVSSLWQHKAAFMAHLEVAF